MMNYMGSWGPILDTVEVIAAKRMAKMDCGTLVTHSATW